MIFINSKQHKHKFTSVVNMVTLKDHWPLIWPFSYKYLYLSLLNLSSICLSVCLSRFVLPGNTPQYLSQMKSDLHKTSRISSWASPKVIKHFKATIRHVVVWINIFPHMLLLLYFPCYYVIFSFPYRSGFLCFW